MAMIFLKKSVIVLLMATMVATPITRPENAKEVKAEQLGSLANEVTGTWSYWDGNKDVVQTNKMLLDKLPTKKNQRKYRFTTNAISVTFRSTQTQIEKGQVYNIYVDDILKIASVTDGTYTINDVEEGKHTVTIKADFGNADKISCKPVKFYE